jgi:hypothetical protein
MRDDATLTGEVLTLFLDENNEILSISLKQTREVDSFSIAIAREIKLTEPLIAPKKVESAAQGMEPEEEPSIIRKYWWAFAIGAIVLSSLTNDEPLASDKKKE